MNQLPGYCHFKEPGALGSALATDVQASGELIFWLLLELEILGLMASGSAIAACHIPALLEDPTHKQQGPQALSVPHKHSFLPLCPPHKLLVTAMLLCDSPTSDLSYKHSHMTWGSGDSP